MAGWIPQVCWTALRCDSLWFIFFRHSFLYRDKKRAEWRWGSCWCSVSADSVSSNRTLTAAITHTRTRAHLKFQRLLVDDDSAAHVTDVFSILTGLIKLPPFFEYPPPYDLWDFPPHVSLMSATLGPIPAGGSLTYLPLVAVLLMLLIADKKQLLIMWILLPSEPPAEHIDLTALVNTLINTSQSGTFVRIPVDSWTVNPLNVS